MLIHWFSEIFCGGCNKDLWDWHREQGGLFRLFCPVGPSNVVLYLLSTERKKVKKKTHTPWTHTQNPYTRSPLVHSLQLTSSLPTSSGCKAASLAFWASALRIATYRSIKKNGLLSPFTYTLRREAQANPHPYSFKLVFFFISNDVRSGRFEEHLCALDEGLAKIMLPQIIGSRPTEWLQNEMCYPKLKKMRLWDLILRHFQVIDRFRRTSYSERSARIAAGWGFARLKSTGQIQMILLPVAGVFLCLWKKLLRVLSVWHFTAMS